MNRRAASVSGLAVCALGAFMALGTVLWLLVLHSTPSILAGQPAGASPGSPTISVTESTEVRTPSGSAENKAGDWGNVKGRIVLDAAAAPVPPTLDVKKDPEACLAKGPLLSEELIVKKDDLGVKNAFVWLIPTDPAKPLAI